MTFPDISDIKRTAVARVQQTPNTRRLIMIHAGIPAVLSLVLTALSYILSLQIADTGGLSGMGLRSVLETLQNMLQVISVAFSLFWTLGLVASVLRWSRGGPAEDRDLLAGFRHWGPVFRSALLKMFIALAVVLLASQVSSVVYSMTPLSKELLSIVENMMNDLTYMPTDAQLLDAMVSYLPFLGVSLALFGLPVYYRLRMMDYALMDEPEKGAFHAMRMSLLMTQRNCVKLFKLDVSFWWFYLLELATLLVYYGDVVLHLAGVDVGVSSEVLLFIACIAGLVLQFGLYVWRQNQVSASYALVYDSLKHSLPEPSQQEDTSI